MYSGLTTRFYQYIVINPTRQLPFGQSGVTPRANLRNKLFVSLFYYPAFRFIYHRLLYNDVSILYNSEWYYMVL